MTGATQTSPLTALRDVLGVAAVYKSFQRIVGGRARDTYVREHVRPGSRDRVLDIGCGTGDILEHLPAEVDYVGFDANERYIAYARARFGERAQFFSRKVTDVVGVELGGFDVVLANGVVHHLTDEEAIDLFEVAKTALADSGRLITLDGCVVRGQSRIARYLLAHDRGRFVRTEEAYVTLARRVFAHVKSDIRHDLMRIPYTHIIMECRP